MIRAATIALLLVACIALADGVVQESGRQIYQYNGTSSKLDLSSYVGTIGALAEGTLSMWVRPNVATAGGQNFFCVADGGDTASLFILQYRNLSGTLAFRVFVAEVPTTYLDIRTTTSYAANQTYHVAYRSSSAGNALFVNGVAASVTYATGSSASSVFFSSISDADTIYIGGSRAGGADTSFFNGDVSDARVYDYSMTDAEIRALASYRGSTNFNGQSVSDPHAIQPDLTSVPDRSSAGNDGTPTDLTWGAGVGEFNGTSSDVTVPDNDDFSFTSGSGNDDPFSISAWINMDDASAFRIIAKYGATAGDHEWLFSTTAADLPFLACYDAGGDRVGRTAPAITAHEGSWIHIAATYSGNNLASGIDIYINGVVADDADFNNGTYNGMANTTTPVYIGALPQVPSWSDGQESDVRVYNYALSAAEIRALASYRGSTNFNGQAVSYPHAIQPDLTSVPDRSSAGNDGTPTDLTWGAGGGEFNGSSSIVTVPDSASLTFTDAGTQDLPFSVSCWVRNYGTSLGIVSKQVYPWSGLGDYAVGCSAGRPFIGVTQGAWGNDRRLIADDALTTGTWHHVAATYDGREGTAAYNGMDVYVDGQSVAATPSINGSYTRMQDTAYNVIVGSWANVHANGAFANLSVYSDVITSNEVATLYAAGRDAPADAISTNNLVLFYDFEADKENKLVLALGPTAASYSTGDSITNGTLILDTSIEANHGTCTDIVVGGVR